MNIKSLKLRVGGWGNGLMSKHLLSYHEDWNSDSPASRRVLGGYGRPPAIPVSQKVPEQAELDEFGNCGAVRDCLSVECGGKRRAMKEDSQHQCLSSIHTWTCVPTHPRAHAPTWERKMSPLWSLKEYALKEESVGTLFLSLNVQICYEHLLINCRLL